jgi:hypothetical protein
MPNPLFVGFKGKGKKVKVSLCLTNKTLRYEVEWGSGCMDPRIFCLGTS